MFSLAPFPLNLTIRIQDGLSPTSTLSQLDEDANAKAGPAPSTLVQSPTTDSRRKAHLRRRLSPALHPHKRHIPNQVVPPLWSQPCNCTFAVLYSRVCPPICLLFRPPCLCNLQPLLGVFCRAGRTPDPATSEHCNACRVEVGRDKQCPRRQFLNPNACASPSY
jgi:hypothetical protein